MPGAIPFFMAAHHAAAAEDSPGGGGGGEEDYEGPLDILVGAVCAYSAARALSSDMRGEALYTVRESGGDTTQEFESDATTGEAPAAAITSFINGATGYVTIWNDQSGTGADVIDTMESLNPPMWSATVNGGKPGLVRESTEDAASRLISDYLLSFPSGTGTFFMVVKGRTFAELQDIDEEQYIETRAGVIAFVDSYDGDNEAGGNYNGLISESEWVLIDTAISFGANDYRVNGVSFPENNDNDSGGAVGALSALRCRLDHGAEAGNGWQELIIYPGVKSDPDRLAIRQNIASYYGITLP